MLKIHVTRRLYYKDSCFSYATDMGLDIACLANADVRTQTSLLHAHGCNRIASCHGLHGSDDQTTVHHIIFFQKVIGQRTIKHLKNALLQGNLIAPGEHMSCSAICADWAAAVCVDWAAAQPSDLYHAHAV